MATIATATAPASTPAVKALTCPACGGAVTLRAAGYSVSVACEYCGSILDVANPEVRLITKYQQALAGLAIKLGTRGTLKGVEWEAVGYLGRSEHGSYPWNEYLLFNPYHGYRWLVGDGRGWSFGEMLTRTPVGSRFGTDGVMLDDQDYRGFFRDGEAQVDYVLGEFYWRVAVGETVATDDYVRPGWMLSREANGEEISWTLSELLDPKEMQRAFGVAPPDDPWPPLPHQPSPYGALIRTWGKIGLAAAAFLLLLSLVLGGHSRLLEQRLDVPMDGRARTATLGPVTLTRAHQIVAIEADAPDVENQWIDLDYSLVDRKTQASYDAYGLVEHYSGRDSDGPWTEGSRHTTIKIAAVPAGTYDLVVDYTGTVWTGSSYTPSFGDSGWGSTPSGKQLTLIVRSGIIFPSNFLLAAIMMLLPLLFLVRNHIRFERARQAESDAPPTGLAALFKSGEDDE
jgi:hypothetical protein